MIRLREAVVPCFLIRSAYLYAAESGTQVAQHRCAPCWWEHTPEAERLIARASYYRLAVWREGKVENPRGVSSKGGDLRHGGITPHSDLVL